MEKRKSARREAPKAEKGRTKGALKARGKGPGAPKRGTGEERVFHSIRRMTCPEERGIAELLLTWKVERGRKVLGSIACDHFQLADLSGSDCRWLCWAKIAGGKS